MALVEIREQALDPGTTARPARHPLRKYAAIAVAARRTLFAQHAMCSHLQLQGRQVKDLPALRVGLAGHRGQRCTAGHALHRLVDACLIRDSHLLLRRTWMARLATGLSARGLTQRARLFGKTVTGRRLAAVAAIRGQLVFECFDPCPQLGNLRLLLVNERTETLNQRNDRFWAVVVGSSDLFMG